MRKLLIIFYGFFLLLDITNGQKDVNARFTVDSINGVYIPKNLEDCFKQIDSFWADSIKQKVRAMSEREFSGQAHFGFGLWMRNNWQLWSGSRLSKYFNE